MTLQENSQRKQLFTLFLDIFSPAKKYKNKIVLTFVNANNKANKDKQIEKHNQTNIFIEKDNNDKSTDFVAKKTKKQLRKERGHNMQANLSQAFTDIFTALWTNYVENTNEFKCFQKVDFYKQLSCSCRSHTAETNAQNTKHLMSHLTTGQLLEKRHLPTLLTSVYSLNVLEKQENYNRLIDVINAFPEDEHVIKQWQENKQILQFFSLLTNNSIVKDAYDALQSKGFLQNFDSIDEFLNVLKKMWFEPFNSGTYRCGFHHVHIGALHSKKSTMSGMHSWVRYLQLETQNRAEYLGYYAVYPTVGLAGVSFRVKSNKTRDLDTENAKVKKISTMMIGVPPEFEFIIYSAAVLINPNRATHFKIKDTKMTLLPRTNNKVGVVVTAYFSDCED